MSENASTLQSAGIRGSAATGVVVGGLGVGAVLGFGGNFLNSGPAQDLLYAISATGLIVAAVVLAIEHATARRLLLAAGFTILALAETRLVNQTSAPGAASSFAVGLMLYAPALGLIGASSWAPRWVRVVGVAAAAVFAAYALAFFGGADVAAAGALQGVGYALFTLTTVGWILTVLRDRSSLTRTG